MSQQKPIKVKVKNPRRPQENSKKVRQALKLGRYDEAEQLTHRKAA